MDEDETHEDYPTTQEEYDAEQEQIQSDNRKFQAFCHKVAVEIREAREKKNGKRE